MTTVSAARPLPAASRMSPWRAAAIGAGLGFGWGVSARAWMRFISTDPEFSWSGTAYIILAFTLVGLLTGLAYVAQRNGWPRWRTRAVRIAAGGSFLLLGLGAGSLVVPTVLYAGLALSGRPLGWVARLVLGLVTIPIVVGVVGGPPAGAFAVVVMVGYAALLVLLAVGKGTRLVLWLFALPTFLVVAGTLYEDLPAWRATLGLAIYLGLLVPLVWGFRKIVQPARDSSAQATPVGERTNP